jgi:hypothetical protein
MASEADKLAKYQRRRKAWHQVRERGKMPFVLYAWTLGAGGSMFFVIALLHFFTSHQKPNWMVVLGALILCPIAGFLLGLLDWGWKEKKYAEKTPQ